MIIPQIPTGVWSRNRGSEQYTRRERDNAKPLPQCRADPRLPNGFRASCNRLHADRLCGSGFAASLTRPVPDRLPVARRCRVPWQVIEYLEPRHLLFDMHMCPRHDSGRIAEAAHIQIDVIRPLVAFICHWGTAAVAEAAPHTRRGRVHFRRSLRVSKIRASNDQKCSDGRRCIAPAAFAMTMDDLQWYT